MRTLRGLFVTLILLIFFPLPASPEGGRSIQTSRGEVKVTIPEGMSAEDAFYEMAALYWEERYDLEDALAQIKKLNISIDEYVKAVGDKEKALQDQIKIFNKLKFGLVFGAEYGIKDTFPEITFGGSMLIKRWMSINLYLTSQLQLGADISIFF